MGKDIGSGDEMKIASPEAQLRHLKEKLTAYRALDRYCGIIGKSGSVKDLEDIYFDNKNDPIIAQAKTLCGHGMVPADQLGGA